MWLLTKKTVCLQFKKVIRIKKCRLSNAFYQNSNRTKYVHQELVNIVQKYTGTTPVPCEKIIHQFFNAIKVQDKTEGYISTDIFKSCVELKLPELALYHYKFLKSENCDISSTQYYFILKMLAACPTNVAKKDVMEIYNDLKPILLNKKQGYPLIDAAVEAFCSYQEIWSEFKDLPDFQESSLAASYLIKGAFTFNHPEYGWNLLKQKKIMTAHMSDAYFKHCIHLAQNNKFSLEVLNDFVQFCQENFLVFYQNTLFQHVDVLVKMLNMNKGTPYVWNVKKSKVSSEGNCSSCKLKLLDAEISKDELELLKKNFHSDIIINKNINIKTSKAEISKFMKFLQKNPDFDIVIDGLNLYHLSNKLNKGLRIIRDFHFRNLKILVIAKNYLKNDHDFASLQKMATVFMAETLSDDDIFFIYAALHKGLNAKFVTRDFLRGYGYLLHDKYLKNLFTKWQLTHQYVMNPTAIEVFPPVNHAFLPQITKMTEEDYCWHIPITVSQYSFPECRKSDHVWLCLRRVAKK